MTRGIRRFGTVVMALAVLGATAAAPASAAELVMVELLPLPTDSWARPVAMNVHGVTAGESIGDHGAQPVRWDRSGRPTALPTLGHHVFHVSDINDAGSVVGLANTLDGVPHAVLWRPDGAVVDLGATHPQLASHAAAINDQGVVAGHVNGRAVLWAPDGRLVKLWSPAGASQTTADRIAEDGTVIGTVVGLDAGEGFYRSIRWDGAAHLPTLLPVGVHLTTVAGLGWTGGYVVPPGTEGCHGAVWDAAGRMTAAGTLPGGTYSSVEAVNRHGAAVGSGDTADGSRRAVRWDPAGAVTELPGPVDVAFVVATDIADDGSAVGYAQAHGWPPVTRALRWDRFGEAIELDTLPGTLGAIPIAVNEHGMVLGTAHSVSSGDRAVLWR